MSKINKALDLSKLFEAQAGGKLLKKHLLFPMYRSTKYDGNYIVAQVVGESVLFVTSGGLNYTHTDGGGSFFRQLPDGAYLAERVYGEGKLGDRDKCNLKGPKSAQTSTGHNYRVFDYLTIDEYIAGESKEPFMGRYNHIKLYVPADQLAEQHLVRSQADLDQVTDYIVKQGYEGVMAISPAHLWKDTKSRTVDLIKYKKRRTADLLCIGETEGEGKYEGMVGALILRDSEGRVVSVGSGLSDGQRGDLDNHVGKVYEIEFERIADTYIQPTLIRVRDDKTEEDID